MAVDAETVSRKTFRLDTDAAEILANESARYANENQAINGCLRDLKRTRENLATKEIFSANERTCTDEANQIARDWKDKYDAKCVELQQLQSALQLVGKFLRPAEL